MTYLRGSGLCTILLVAVSACGGGGGGGGPGSGSVTVSGKVVSIIDTPVANIAVVVDGQGPVVSDANGDFTFQGVRVPYDAIVFDGADGVAFVYQGLTRADPTFTYTGPGGGIAPPTASATVAGIVSGGVGLPVPPPPPEVETDVSLWVTAGDLFGSASATPNSTTGAYNESNLEWPGVAPYELTITALQYQVDGAGLPTTFTGYGQLTTPISNGDALVNQDINMGPLATTTASGTTTFPPSVVTLFRIMLLELPGGAFLGLPSETGGAPNFALQGPDVPGLERTLLTFGQTVAGDTVFHATDTLPAPASGLAITLPEIAGPLLPIDGQTGVDYTTPFSTAPALDNSVYFVEFSPDGGGPGPEIELVTTQTVFTIPDLSAFGVTLPAGGEYSWQVVSRGPAASVDDVAVPPTFSATIFFGLPGTGERFGTSSSSRTFFLAP